MAFHRAGFNNIFLPNSRGVWYGGCQFVARGGRHRDERKNLAMTARQIKARFAASNAMRPSVERIMKMLDETERRFKANPAEARDLGIRAGVFTPTGRWTKPYRMMIKEDTEKAIEREKALKEAAREKVPT